MPLILIASGAAQVVAMYKVYVKDLAMSLVMIERAQQGVEQGYGPQSQQQAAAAAEEKLLATQQELAALMEALAMYCPPTVKKLHMYNLESLTVAEGVLCWRRLKWAACSRLASSAPRHGRPPACGLHG